MRKTIAAAVMLVLLPGSLSYAQQREDEKAALEFQNIMKELHGMSRTLPADKLLEALEDRLEPFIEKYPGSPEAARAHYNLGQFYSQSRMPEPAIEHLNKYLSIESIRNPREEVMAHYMIASSYVTMEDFEKAETAFRAMAENTAFESRTRQLAARELEKLPILRKLRIGLPAIPFSAKTYGGKTLNLSDLKGKVVLLDFWATWCGPCKQEMPNVRKVYDEYHDKGFEIVGISLDQDRTAFETYLTSNRIEWPQIFDGKGWKAELGARYAVSSIPATFLLDREGKIRHKDLRGPALRTAVGELIEEK